MGEMRENIFSIVHSFFFIPVLTKYSYLHLFVPLLGVYLHTRVYTSRGRIYSFILINIQCLPSAFNIIGQWIIV